MIRLLFVWIFQLVFFVLIIGILSWTMKKSWVVKSCVLGYDVRSPG
jgi:hypothetical protein